MPPRPKRSAPDCQLSARGKEVLKAGRLALGPKLVWPLAGQANSSLLPSLLSLPVQKPEQRGPRDPTNRDPASYDSLRSVCVMKDASDSQPQEQLYVAAQRPHRRPLTQDPRCWRPLNITASCGRTVWPACHAHCLWSGCPDPGPPPDPQCARQSGLASFTPHPSLRFSVQFGGVAAHPPHMLAPSIPGGCARYRVLHHRFSGLQCPTWPHHSTKQPPKST